jgi:hypothetical protein
MRHSPGPRGSGRAPGGHPVRSDHRRPDNPDRTGTHVPAPTPAAKRTPKYASRSGGSVPKSRSSPDIGTASSRAANIKPGPRSQAATSRAGGKPGGYSPAARPAPGAATPPAQRVPQTTAAVHHRAHPGSNAILEGRMLSWDDVKAHALDRQATSVGSTSRWDEVHRSVHARTSLQNQRTSVHAPSPSGTIWFLCRSIPHSQQETTAARRAAIPSAAGVLIVSAMPRSPPGYWSAIPIAWPKSPGPAAGSTTAGWMLGDNRASGWSEWRCQRSTGYPASAVLHTMSPNASWMLGR